MNKERNIAIDIARVIGLVLIFAAHSSFKSQTFFELRIFDVVLLVFLSVLSFDITYKNQRYIDYVKKRFKRLVLPVWMFLVIYFLVFIYILKFDYSLYTIATSFCLLSGIGYIWIFRVMFINSLICPLIKKYESSIDKYMLIIILIMLIGNDFLYHVIINLPISNFMILLLKTAINFTLGYVVVTIVALGWKKVKNKVSYILIFGLMFMISMLLYMRPISEFKYPPQSVYILYGLFMSAFVYEACKMIKIKSDKVKDMIVWISKNSFNIYLVHIIILNLTQKYFIFMNDITGIYKLVILLGLSGVIWYLYDTFKRKIVRQTWK